MLHSHTSEHAADLAHAGRRCSNVLSAEISADRNMLKMQPANDFANRGALRSSLLVSSGTYVRLPESAKDMSHSPGMLRRDELVALIANLRDKIVDGAVAIVQSGNRYLYEYVKASSALPVCNIKMTSLAKCPPYKTLNTLLTSRERQAALPKECIDELHAASDELSAANRGCIHTSCRSSFGDIGKLYRCGTTGDVIQALCNVPLQLPFTEPTHGQTRFHEMTTTLGQVRAGESVLCTDRLLSVILARCSLARLLASSRTVSIVDHVIYRGRTLYAMAWIMRLLNIENWSFYALCADSLAASVQWHRATILAPGRLYPYENSIATEGGYWDEVESHFEFRELREYQRFLHGSLGAVAVSGEFPQVIACWQRLVTDLDALVTLPLENKEFRLALIVMLVHAKALGRCIPLAALQNQRASNIGYCPHWATYCEKYICQTNDLKIRDSFNQNVAKSVLLINGLLSGTGAELGAKAVQFYTQHRLRIDYFALDRLLCQDRGPRIIECRRECQSEKANQPVSKRAFVR
jgi:hypothetical protein